MNRILARLVVWSLFLIAAAGANAADELLVAPDDAPQYRLGGVQVEDGRFGRAEMVIPYTRVREGEGLVILAGRSKDGPLSIMGITPRPDEASGEFRLNKMFSMGRNASYDYEFYLVSSAHWAGKSYGQCLVSNMVRIGNPGGSPRTRQWNAEERAAYEKHLLGKKPPESPPAGFVEVDAQTPLLPGMPVKVGYYGDWKDAEYINDVNHALANIRFTDQPRLQRKPREGWLAVDPAVLRRGEQDPSQFAASVRVLPGGSVPAPDGVVPLPAGTRLLVGAPLLYEWAGELKDAYVLAADTSGVKVRYEGYSSSFDKENPWSYYAIREETLKRLEEPGAAEEFAANIEADRQSSASAFPSGGSVRAGVAGAPAKRFREYKVTIPVPQGAQFIPDDLTLDEGTLVAGCWARKWNPVTVLSENADGTVNVHWDDYSDAWDCSMRRDQLIIQDKTVRKLRRKHGAKVAGAAGDLAKTLRTWTDASGQHKIEARFVRRSDDKVTIRTDAGREVTLAIAKLSDEDQQLLEDVKPAAAAENPFE